jgi:hypothetical protein
MESFMGAEVADIGFSSDIKLFFIILETVARLTSDSLNQPLHNLIIGNF